MIIFDISLPAVKAVIEAQVSRY